MESLPELGVPAYYWGTNAIHGIDIGSCTAEGHCPTGFPSGPNVASTFNRGLVQQMAAVLGTEMRALYNLGLVRGLDIWGPVINLNRDPRWGRNAQAGAECPYLMGQVAIAWTRGFQYHPAASRFLQGVVTLKHFDANSLEGGSPSDKGLARDSIDVNVSNYMLGDTYFPAFKAPIREAGALGIMCSCDLT